MARRREIARSNSSGQETPPQPGPHRRGSLVGRTLSVALVAIVVAACGSSTGGESPAGETSGAGNTAATSNGGGQNATQQVNNPPVDLCTLWTASELNAAVGGTLGDGTAQMDGLQCRWSGGGDQVIMSIDQPGGTYADVCSVSSPSIIAVDGIGDAACLLVAGTFGASLDFKKGDFSYTLQVVLANGTVDAIEAAEKTLGTAAAPKL
jgi:hypothetical protein